jgi:hypothetical protein
VGPRDGLESMEMRKILPCREKNPDSLVVTIPTDVSRRPVLKRNEHVSKSAWPLVSESWA